MNLELQRSKHAASAALKAKSPVRMDTTTKLKALVTDAARPKLKNGFHSEG
ncbi:MAG: hypothetical protein JSS56_17140 [Proteobacteria bacterium]|nr:hypothetical protein [Pseudomonadota bacterium]